MKSAGLLAALRTLLLSAALMLAVVLLNFLLLHAAPGDPVDVIAGASGGLSPELAARLRADYGLDQPLPLQFGRYLGQVLSGHLGDSIYFNRPVLSLIAERLPATLLLVSSAVLGAFVLGTALGVLAARRPGGVLSHLIVVLSMAGFAAPVFWSGILLMILFGSWWPILPVGGMRAADSDLAFGSFADALDVARHLVLPATTLGLVSLAQYSRLARAAMLEVLGADYIRTARAKGLAERLVYTRHALRNALLPVVTMLGLQFGNVMAGAILVESVFNWPGLGRLAYESVLRRDTPTLLGLLLISSLVVIVLNRLTDLAYRWLDPRIRS